MIPRDPRPFHEQIRDAEQFWLDEEMDKEDLRAARDAEREHDADAKRDSRGFEP